MKSSCSRKFWNSLGLAVCGGALLVSLSHRAVAQTSFTSPSPSPPTPEEARAFLKVDLLQRLCERKVVFSVENATLEDVATRVAKALTASAPQPTSAIHIEVRNVRPIRLSFAAKESTVGNILSSAAMLAGAQLWVFSDHLLLAPQESLSPEEQDAVSKGFAMSLQSSSLPYRNTGVGPSVTMQRRAFSAFIADEMKGLTPNGGVLGAANTPRPIQNGAENLPAKRALLAPTTSASLDQLSPESQAMIRELCTQLTDPDMQPRLPRNVSFPPLTLGNSNLVELSTENNEGILKVNLEGADGTTGSVRWSLSGDMTGRSFSGPVKKSSPSNTPQVGIPADPSAGKS